MAVLLTRFHAIAPPFRIAQARSLAWLARAHAEAEASLRRLDEAQRAAFEARIAHLLARCACPPDRIAWRGHSIADVDRATWNDNELYDLPRHPHGRGSAARTRLFSRLVDQYLVDAYTDEDAPDEMIHVTCTGYASPSGAQRLVAARRWETRVTHAYQMGCYAAVPAVRLAAGALATGARRVDLVHTELCSLHLAPSDHTIEQLVVQSLFADGVIRYSAVADEGAHGLRLIAVHERVIPDSAEAMSWCVGDHGMRMTLARDVPDRLAGALRAFVIELYARAGLAITALRDCVFAVHPGGPKIIDQVRHVLELTPEQVAASVGVLRDHGNMSSATLPHIWSRLVEDPAIAAGTLVASLAFGPGLTLCGALFEKR